MSYYVRYIVTAGQAVTLPEIEKALQQADPAYQLDEGDCILLGDENYGQVEISTEAGEIEEEAEEEIEMLEDPDEENPHRESLLAAWKAAKSIVAIRVLWGDRDEEATMAGLKPLFDWLLANRAGLLTMDDGTVLSADGPVD